MLSPAARRALAAALALPAAHAARPAAAQQFGVGQSFTAPVGPASVLTALDVGAAGLFGIGGTGSDFTARIYAFTPTTNGGGTLTGQSLFSQYLGASYGGFSLTPNVTLVGGATYAVVVLSPSSSAVFGNGTSGDTFAGGSAVACVGSTTVTCYQAFAPGDDVTGFSVTFAPAVTGVPEPATWALLGTGLLAVGGMARRRRGTQA